MDGRPASRRGALTPRPSPRRIPQGNLKSTTGQTVRVPPPAIDPRGVELALKVRRGPRDRQDHTLERRVRPDDAAPRSDRPKAPFRARFPPRAPAKNQSTTTSLLSGASPPRRPPRSRLSSHLPTPPRDSQAESAWHQRALASLYAATRSEPPASVGRSLSAQTRALLEEFRDTGGEGASEGPANVVIRA